jgi:Fe-Mn family superoxide dismutase
MQNQITRREALQKASLLAAAAAAAPVIGSTSAQAADAAGGAPFTLPPLPYALDALEPHIDAQTMQIHHGKHHLAYITNLNKAVAGSALEKQSVEDLLRKLKTLPEDVRKTVQNHGGGHANHSLFWLSLKKNEGGRPGGELARAMERKWNSYDGFKAEFTKAATTLFGSGWAWLSLDGKELIIEQTANQDSPLMQGRVPLLGLDVWEHAYYLKYQNRRPDYVAAFFNVINWDFVAERFARGQA